MKKNNKQRESYFLIRIWAKFVINKRTIRKYSINEYKKTKFKRNYYKGHLLYVNYLIKLKEKYNTSASKDTDISICYYFQGFCVNYY